MCCEGRRWEILNRVRTVIGTDAWVSAAAGANCLAVLATGFEVFREHKVTLRNIRGNKYCVRPNVSARTIQGPCSLGLPQLEPMLRRREEVRSWRGLQGSGIHHTHPRRRSGDNRESPDVCMWRQCIGFY